MATNDLSKECVVEIPHELVGAEVQEIIDERIFAAFCQLWMGWLDKGAPAGDYKLTLRLERAE